MDILLYIIVFVAGAGLGAAGYRYNLKRNPERLEGWARSIKIAREAAEAKLR